MATPTKPEVNYLEVSLKYDEAIEEASRLRQIRMRVLALGDKVGRKLRAVERQVDEYRAKKGRLRKAIKLSSSHQVLSGHKKNISEDDSVILRRDVATRQLFGTDDTGEASTDVTISEIDGKKGRRESINQVIVVPAGTGSASAKPHYQREEMQVAIDFHGPGDMAQCETDDDTVTFDHALSILEGESCNLSPDKVCHDNSVHVGSDDDLDDNVLCSAMDTYEQSAEGVKKSGGRGGKAKNLTIATGIESSVDENGNNGEIGSGVGSGDDGREEESGTVAQGNGDVANEVIEKGDSESKGTEGGEGGNPDDGARKVSGTESKNAGNVPRTRKKRFASYDDEVKAKLGGYNRKRKRGDDAVSDAEDEVSFKVPPQKSRTKEKRPKTRRCVQKK